MARIRPSACVCLEHQGSQLPVCKHTSSSALLRDNCQPAWYIDSKFKHSVAVRVLHGVVVSSTPCCVAVKSREKCSGIHYRVKCHRFNLYPSEPCSPLIWTYRDVAAEHHKGAAYQHRCYLLRLFHRGARSPIRTPPLLDSDQGHLHWVKRDGTTRPSPSAQHRLRLGRKSLDKR